MRVCMAPSSPPVKRTLHLLQIPDILLANDSRQAGTYSDVTPTAHRVRPRCPLTQDSAMPGSECAHCANTVCTAAKSRFLRTLRPIFLFLLLEPMLDSEGAKQRLVRNPVSASAVTVCRHRRSLCSVQGKLAIFGSYRSRIPLRGSPAHAPYWPRLHSQAQS